MIFSANKRAVESLAGLGRFTLLAKEAAASLFTFKVAWRDLIYQIFFMGVKSQTVVLITGAFTGMVLGCANLFSVSQGQNGHGHARGRQCFHVRANWGRC